MQPPPRKRDTQSQDELLRAVQEIVLPAVRAGADPGLFVAESGGHNTGFLFALQGEATLQLAPPVTLVAGACCLISTGIELCEIKPENGASFPAYSKILTISPVTSGAFCHIAVLQSGKLYCPMPLYVADSQLSYLMQQAHQETAKRDLDFEALASAYLLAFFLRLHRALLQTSAIETPVTPAMALGAETLPRDDKSESTEVLRARQHIEGNLQGQLTLISIAAHVHTSPSHLNRLFNLSLGTSVMKYVAARRIEAAKSLLIQTDLAVHVVGQLTGYPQHAHFTQTFTQHVKLAPQEYRKRYKIDHRGL